MNNCINIVISGSTRVRSEAEPQPHLVKLSCLLQFFPKVSFTKFSNNSLSFTGLF